MFSLVKGCVRHQLSSINSVTKVLQRRQQVQQIIIGLDNGTFTLSSLLNEIQILDNTNSNSTTITTTYKRYYITRAHPKPKPEVAILNALNDILDDVEQRKIKRSKRFKNIEKWNTKRIAKTIEMTDTTITTTTIPNEQQPTNEVETTSNTENDNNNDISTDITTEKSTSTTVSATATATATESSSRAVVPKMKQHPDETIEIAINLNVDPRKPGQALRGTMSLPYGSGKKVNCIVFTSNEYIQQLAIKAGATCAGGDDMIDQIVSGTIPIDQFQRSIGTKDIMSILSKKLARVLGPRGLMPNDKLGTILPPVSSAATQIDIDDSIQTNLISMIQTITAGKEITYRTEKEGIVHVPIGRASFGSTKLLSNIGQIMQVLYDNKPDVYGKGKKGTQKSVGKNTKYFLSVFLSSTQGISRKIDLRTVDPSSPYFLSDPTSAGAIITKSSSLLSIEQESEESNNNQSIAA